MENRAAEIPFPPVALKVVSTTVAVPGEFEKEAPEKREAILFPNITSVLGFERAISIALIVFGLMTLSMVSYHSLMAKFDTREARTSIQQTRADTGRYREEIQAIQGELEKMAASEQLITFPIDPSDVAMVTLPVGDR